MLLQDLFKLIIGTFYRLKRTQAPPSIPQQQWLHHPQQLLSQHLYIHSIETHTFMPMYLHLTYLFLVGLTSLILKTYM